MTNILDPIMHRCYESARACEVEARISHGEFLAYKRAHRRNCVPATVDGDIYYFGGGYSFTKVGDEWLGRAPSAF